MTRTWMLTQSLCGHWHSPREQRKTPHQRDKEQPTGDKVFWNSSFGRTRPQESNYITRESAIRFAKTTEILGKSVLSAPGCPVTLQYHRITEALEWLIHA
jgi:hypothetical protein